MRRRFLLPRLFDTDYRYGARFALRSFLLPLNLRLVRLRRATLARRQRLVMVTGSQGKTTTTRCVRAALELPADRDVMLSPNLPRSIVVMLLRQSPFRRHAVAEAAIARAGDMPRRMELLRPAVSVVTSVGTEHHRRFPDLRALRDEKAQAVRLLPASGIAILNGDDPNVASMAAETRARAVTFGLGEDVDVRASDVRLDWPRGMTFTVESGAQRVAARTRLLGPAGVYAALGGIAASWAEGVPLEVAAERVARVPPTRRRNEPMRIGPDAWALMDDSKAPPETIGPFLELARAVPAPRKLFLLGRLGPAPGDRAAFYREVGCAVAKLAALVVVVGDEDAAELFAPGFAGGGLAADQVLRARHAREAGELLRGRLQPGDVLFVKAEGNLRLTRAVLSLAGRDVRCARTLCKLAAANCETCQLLGVAQSGPR